MRFKCPIYTTEDILKKAGIILDFEKEAAVQPGAEPVTSPKNVQVLDSSFMEEIRKSNLQELKDLLEEAVKDENYEKASLIRDEINRRKKK